MGSLFHNYARLAWWDGAGHEMEGQTLQSVSRVGVSKSLVLIPTRCISTCDPGRVAISPAALQSWCRAPIPCTLLSTSCGFQHGRKQLLLFFSAYSCNLIPRHGFLPPIGYLSQSHLPVSLMLGLECQEGWSVEGGLVTGNSTLSYYCRDADSHFWRCVTVSSPLLWRYRKVQEAAFVHSYLISWCSLQTQRED